MSSDIDKDYYVIIKNTPYSISKILFKEEDHLCGLVFRVPGYRSRGPGFIEK
jgi:hypothetical protein